VVSGQYDEIETGSKEHRRRQDLPELFDYKRKETRFYHIGFLCIREDFRRCSSGAISHFPTNIPSESIIVRSLVMAIPILPASLLVRPAPRQAPRFGDLRQVPRIDAEKDGPNARSPPPATNASIPQSRDRPRQSRDRPY
jgi:hypothetical protein